MGWGGGGGERERRPLTGSVIRVVKLDHHRVSVVGYVEGRALVVGELDGRQAGVIGGLGRDYVYGGLAAPFGDGVVLVPQGWAWREQHTRMARWHVIWLFTERCVYH